MGFGRPQHAPREADETDLEAFARAAAAASDSSGIYSLPIAQESFAARGLLARAAQRSLDVQYYIWRGDTTGNLLLEELWNAAERGVRVRLLLDDNGVSGLDETLAALDSHRNIEVRLFNPFTRRRHRWLDYLTDFRRLNRRMHNKSFTADSVAAIVGGRNVGDEYFGAGQGLLFADLDVLAIGTVAREIGAAFERYWSSDAVAPAEQVIGGPRRGAVAAMLARFAAVRRSSNAVACVAALRKTRLVESVIERKSPLDWVRARLVVDSPSKALGLMSDGAPSIAALLDQLRGAEHHVDLVSPYFVPGRRGAEALSRLAERGVALRVLTNSLAATDVAAVHAGYARHRKRLLRGGVKLYEFMPSAADGLGRAITAAPRRMTGSSSASLHAKTFAIDSKRVFVGSMNLDPRSNRLNTEMGVLIDSAALAGAVARELDRIARQAAYEVVLEPGARELAWVERSAEGESRYRAEPKSSLSRRLWIRVLALLPIEWLL